MKAIFLGHVFATFFMTGLIWLIQVVHYPLFGRVGEAFFTGYEQEHQRLITPLVGIVMMVELVTGFVLVFMQPRGLSAWEAWVGLGLIGVIWLSTLFLQIPAHGALSALFTTENYAKLVQTNWIRTIAWTLRSGMLSWVLYRMLPF